MKMELSLHVLKSLRHGRLIEIMAFNYICPINKLHQYNGKSVVSSSFNFKKLKTKKLQKRKVRSTRRKPC